MQDTCPRCGSAVEPLQEYCVECGQRLRTPGVLPALATGWRRRLGWYPGDWVWPSLAALVVAAVAAAGAIVWTRDAESAARETVVGGTEPLPTVATTTVQTGGGPTVPTTTPARRPPPSRQTRRTLIDWPADRGGWTLVLVSLPMSGGREPALARAREALRSGMPEVGVLDSARYSSLHPGYFVVFSGIYGSLSDAQDAVADAAERGYENAYARRVTR